MGGDVNDSVADQTSLYLDQSTCQTTHDFTIPEKFVEYESRLESMKGRLDGIKMKQSDMMNRLTRLQRTISLVYNDRGIEQYLLEDSEKQITIIDHNNNVVKLEKDLDSSAHNSN